MKNNWDLLKAIAFILFLINSCLLHSADPQPISIGPVLIYEIAKDTIVDNDGKTNDVYFLFAFEKPGESYWQHPECSENMLFAIIPNKSRNADLLIQRVKSHFDKNNPLSTNRRFQLTGTCEKLKDRGFKYLEVKGVDQVIYEPSNLKQ
ncbi:MAG: hypothetical protein AAGB12_08905 [Pseudomonadota bacterium]